MTKYVAILLVVLVLTALVYAATPGTSDPFVLLGEQKSCSLCSTIKVYCDVPRNRLVYTYRAGYAGGIAVSPGCR